LAARHDPPNSRLKEPPDQLGPEHIRQFHAYLLKDRKLAVGDRRSVAALRFFFIRTFKKPAMPQHLQYLILLSLQLPR
jgi:hypothetical protein